MVLLLTVLMSVHNWFVLINTFNRKLSYLVVIVCSFTNKRHIPETNQDSSKQDPGSVNRDLNGAEDEEILWLQIEATMKKRQSYAIETLENLGVVAECDDDDDSEEGQLWKVVEGKAQLTEVV